MPSEEQELEILRALKAGFDKDFETALKNVKNLPKEKIKDAYLSLSRSFSSYHLSHKVNRNDIYEGDKYQYSVRCSFPVTPSYVQEVSSTVPHGFYPLDSFTKNEIIADLAIKNLHLQESLSQRDREEYWRVSTHLSRSKIWESRFANNLI